MVENLHLGTLEGGSIMCCTVLPSIYLPEKTATLPAFFSHIFTSVMYLEIRVHIPDSFECDLGDKQLNCYVTMNM
jgi:hypothetical protein